jgi:hypothetical protein
MMGAHDLLALTRCPSPSTTARPGASAFTLPTAPPASKRWSQFVRMCGAASARSAGRRPRPRRAPRYGSQYLHVRYFPEGIALPRHRELARLRPDTRSNDCAERFIYTLKENLLWARTFETVEQPRQVLLDFRETYNANWLVERYGFRSPTATRAQQLSPAALAP